MTVSLLDLPDELLAQIATQLTVQALIHIQEVCTRLHNVIKSHAALLYAIELYVAGMIDNPASPVVPAEGLRILRQKESGWRTLDLSDRKALTLRHSPSGIYDLTGGVLLLGERRHPDSNTGTDSVHTVRLRSAFGEDVERDQAPLWSHVDLGKQVIDVGLAIQEHDLMAIITYSYINENQLWASIDIHLIQHSTGQPHPAAAKPVLHFDNIHYLPGHCSIMLEVSGDTLCFLLNNYFPFVTADPVTLVVFDWKAGHPKVGQKRLYADPTMFNSFILLSPDTVVLPIIPSNSIEICQFAEEFAAPTPPPPAEGDISPSPPDIPLLKTSCILELPPLHPGALVLRMTCRCEPNPRGPSGAHTDRKLPFFSDPDLAVMILHMHIRLPLGATRVYTMIVHRSSLVKILRSAQESRRATRTVVSSPRSGRRKCNMPLMPGYLQGLDDTDDLEEHEEPLNLIITTMLGDYGEEDEVHVPIGTDAENAEEAVKIPWAEWGPAVTRWFQDEFAGTRWITTTCGQRFVRVRSNGRLHVYDFNSLSLRRYMGKRAAAGEPIGTRRDESLVSAESNEGLWDMGVMDGEEDEDNDEAEWTDEEEEGPSYEEDVMFDGAENSGEDQGGEKANRQQGESAPEGAAAEPGSDAHDPKRRVKVMLGKTVIKDSSAWEGEMVSSLPYIETSVLISEEYESALVDEDIIIGLKMDTNGRHIKEVVLHRIGGPAF